MAESQKSMHLSQWLNYSLLCRLLVAVSSDSAGVLVCAASKRKRKRKGYEGEAALAQDGYGGWGWSWERVAPLRPLTLLEPALIPSAGGHTNLNTRLQDVWLAARVVLLPGIGLDSLPCFGCFTWF